MDRFNMGDEFKLENGKEAYGQGIWAPCIRYHDGKFYIFSNINGHGMQVFIADKAEGPWKHINMGGNIYDLSVLFDDDGKIYAIHKYGAVRMTEIKSDFSGFVDDSERVIIPAGNAMGEGHHVYKIKGKYYILSADYSPMGRMQCARADRIEGPYETCTVSMMETYGVPTGHLVRNVGLGSKVPESGFDFRISDGGGNYMGCATIHQGGIVDTPDGEWWGLSMQDFRSVGRTTCLSPITWKDGWPYFGISGNLGRSPKTWFKPAVSATVEPHAPYDRSDNFNGKTLKPVWQIAYYRSACQGLSLGKKHSDATWNRSRVGDHCHSRCLQAEGWRHCRFGTCQHACRMARCRERRQASCVASAQSGWQQNRGGTGRSHDMAPYDGRFRP